MIYVAKNPVTADSVRVRIKRALGEKSVAMVQIVLNIENTYLYLTHESKDAIKKNKYKYDKADIKHINNFDIDRYLTLDTEQKRRYSRRGLQYYCRSSASEYLGIEKIL